MYLYIRKDLEEVEKESEQAEGSGYFEEEYVGRKTPMGGRR